MYVRTSVEAGLSRAVLAGSVNPNRIGTDSRLDRRDWIWNDKARGVGYIRIAKRPTSGIRVYRGRSPDHPSDHDNRRDHCHENIFARPPRYWGYRVLRDVLESESRGDEILGINSLGSRACAQV